MGGVRSVGGQAGLARASRKVWRTDDVSEVEGFAYFSDAICEAFMELSPSRQSSDVFLAVVESASWDSGIINRVRGSQHSVRRNQAQINRANEPCYYLNIQMHAQCVIGQDDNLTGLNPGQVAIFDGARPFEIHHPQPDEMAVVSLQLPASAVEEAGADYGIDRSRFNGRRISDHPTLGPLIANTVRTLAERQASLNGAEAQVLFDSLVRLSVAACAAHADETPHETGAVHPALLLAVMDFIDQQLGNPEFSVQMAASQANVSTRYIHKMFARYGPSFSQYVREKRLDRVAAELRNPAQRQMTIAEIAFSNGFSDLSSFNRRFKQRFGATPKDIRLV